MAEREKRTVSEDAEDEILDLMGGDEGDESGADDDDDQAPPKKPTDEDEDDEDVDSRGEDEDEEDDEDDDRVLRAEPEDDKSKLLKVKSDKRGNLVDAKTGKIVAPAGPARRFYEERVQAQRSLAQSNQVIQNQRQIMAQAGRALQLMKDQFEAIQKTNDLPKTLGLSSDEHVEFLQLAAKWKTDPQNVLKYLLTKAAQRGITLEAGGAGSNLDLSVITNDINAALDKRLKPFTDRITQSEQQEQEKRAEQLAELNLVTNEPYAQQFLPVLRKMKDQPEFQGLSLSERWLRVQNYLLRQRQARPRGQEGNAPRRSARAMPRGNARPGIDSGEGNQIDDSPVDVNTDFKDIVRQVIRDHGGIDH
jgi:hypothetical protein